MSDKSLKLQIEELKARCDKLEANCEGEEEKSIIHQIRMKVEGAGGVLVSLSVETVGRMVESYRKIIEELEKNPQSAGAHESFRGNVSYADKVKYP